MSPAQSAAGHVLETIRAHVLMDGFGLVFDPEASHGREFHDAVSGRDLLDFYAFFASQPIGFNHPRLSEPEFSQRLLTAARTKVANSDVYTEFYADFVQTLDEVAGLPGMEHFFFIDGGSLAVENALKAAFDWKVRRNLAAGRGEIGQQVVHFRRCFHGRSGYTLSLTDSPDPRKTQYFPRFQWPRIENPHIDFSLPAELREADVAQREARALAALQKAIDQHGHDLAAVIIEPIQGEGGDNHFRTEFFEALRRVCDEHEMLLIFDEVQTGVGATGRMWCCEHFEVLPDILCFGKKMQVCGLMAGPRLDEVPGNVFQTPSRINSTWGANLTDMVRATEYLRIIDEEDLVANAAQVGAYLLERLADLAGRFDVVTAVRGRGLMCAFDLPSDKQRDALRKTCLANGLLMLSCGERSIRFRPTLDVRIEEVDRAIGVLERSLRGLR